MTDLTQQMVDSIFSFAELGFQEFETKKYCTDILEGAGLHDRRERRRDADRVDGHVGQRASRSSRSGRTSTACWRRRRSPASPRTRRSSTGRRDTARATTPGIPLSITAALALKKIMEREKIPGTIKVWPGIAEELLGGKAQFVKAGVFKDVDVCLFSHISSNFGVSWGDGGGTGAVSVEYTFTGQSAHAGGAPWRGRSALDAVELMDVGWNFRREHLRLSQRSHYVITNGGGQPNVVPPTASVWYYFREIDYPHIKEMWDIGNTMAEGGGDDDGHEGDLATARIGLAAAHEQGRRRDDVREHPEGRDADVERRRPGVREAWCSGT